MPFIPDRFFFISNVTNLLIHSLNKFALKKNGYWLLIFFNRVPHIQLSHMIPGVTIIDRKVSLTSVRKPGEILRKILGSKEHLNWLKLDQNVAEVITIQDYKHTQN